MRGVETVKRSEAGFTLIEVLVVILVVGVLTAIALPAFLSQQSKGKDASAKSDARNMAGAVEACEKGKDDFNDCDTQAELGSEAEGFAWGTGPGEVSVTSASANEFVIEAVSRGKTGASNHTFTLARASNGRATRTCTGSQGCASGSW